MQHFAPIALFVYNRPEHTRRTLKFLSQNLLSDESRLFIFSDGPRAEKDKAGVEEVRRLISEVAGFRSVEIVEREKNLGLANSVISGVTQLVNSYGRVIVFEDDLISSPYTLQYFNEALEKYEDNAEVMHIGAYMYPLKAKLPPSFFYRIATSWGWATWKRAWDSFEPDIDVLIPQFTSQKIYDFSVGGTMNFWKQMLEFKAGKNNSWAIRWYASIFLAGGTALHPSTSLVNNIGHDGSGVHSGLNDIYQVGVNNSPVTVFPGKIEELPSVHREILRFLKNRKGNLWQRLVRFVKEKVYAYR